MDDLDFPRVTVCPPKGSNSALNYDLMRADKTLFSDEMRKNIKDVIWKNLFTDQHMIYIQDMLDLVTPANIQSMYDGHQSVPEPYASNRGFQITFETVNGTLLTPRFGEQCRERDFAKSRDLHYVLDLRNPTRSLSDWSLVIQLEVDVVDPRERIELRKGPRYVLYTRTKTWKDAEAQCQKIGGHLASIRSQREQREVEKLLEERRSDRRAVWIGAKRNSKGFDQWNDGSEMSFTNWRFSEKREDCGYIEVGYWYRQSCTSQKRYLCKLAPKTIITKQTFSLKFRKDELVASQLSILYKYESNGSLWIWNRTTGFKMEWFLKDGTGVRINSTNQQSVSQKNSNIGKMIKLAGRARTENMIQNEIIKKAVEEKYKMGLKKANLIDYDECTYGQIKITRGRNPFDKINLGLQSTTFDDSITMDDYIVGFKIYSIIVFCNQETLKLGQFLYNMASNQNLSTIIKVVVNTIELDRVKEGENKNQLFEFYKHLDKTFDLQFGKILLGVSSPYELNTMMRRKLPYITPFSNEIETCFTGKDCTELEKLVNSQGKL